MFVYCLFALFFPYITTTSPESLYQDENECGPAKNTRDECTLNFQKAKVNDQICEPNTFMLIDCNVCRCGLDGKVDKTQCTKYRCNNNQMKTRRHLIEYEGCKPDHWYQLSRCHLCYCVNKHKLMCNSNKTREKVRLGENDFYDCGEKLIKHLSKLVPLENRLLRSVKNKARIESQNIFLKSNVISKLTVEQTTTPNVIFLSPDIEIKFRNFKVRNKASIETDTKSKGFIEDLYDHNKHNDISSLSINSIELNTDSNTDTKSDRNSLHDVDYTTSKETNDENINEDATKLNRGLSNVLDTILGLGVRKSMVSIGSGNDCEPGSTVKKGCNTCFCLANGKSLCTTKICKQ